MKKGQAMENNDLLSIQDKTIALVKEVAQFIAAERKVFTTSDIEYKGRNNNLVSYVDKQAEEKLVRGLGEIFPKAGFVGEEGTDTIGEDGWRWIIDPLDGTTNFMHGLPVYSISVALVKFNDPIVGVIYEVNSNECFYAVKGMGAKLDGKPISVSAINDLNDALIATGFPYHLKGNAENYFSIIKDLVNNSHGIRRLGSAAIDLAYVACGRFEAYLEFNLSSWDVAAGILIVREAGGVVTDYKGSNDCISGNEILAAAHLHKEVLNYIHKYWPN